MKTDPIPFKPRSSQLEQLLCGLDSFQGRSFEDTNVCPSAGENYAEGGQERGLTRLSALLAVDRWLVAVVCAFLPYTNMKMIHLWSSLLSHLLTGLEIVKCF